MLFRLSLTQKDNAKWPTLLCWRAFLSGKRQQSCWDKAQIWFSNQLHHQQHQFFEQHEATGKHYIERSIIKKKNSQADSNQIKDQGCNIEDIDNAPMNSQH